MRLDSNSPDKAFDMQPQGSAFRRTLNTMLFEVHSKQGRRVNMSIMALIVVSVLISMSGTLKGMDDIWIERIRMMEEWVTALFAIEFVMRCYAARNVRAYLFSFYGIVDMLAILPMLLIGDPNLAIRLLRIVRLLKLVRYLRAFRLFIVTRPGWVKTLAFRRRLQHDKIVSWESFTVNRAIVYSA